MKYEVTGIMASDTHFLIGFNDENGSRMPWGINSMKDDLAFFKRVTADRPLVMGRKTLQSLGRFLPKRKHIVFSRQKELKIYNKTIKHYTETKSLKDVPAVLVRSWEEMDVVLNSMYFDPAKKTFLIGGGGLFRSALKEGRMQDIFYTCIKESFKYFGAANENRVYLPHDLCTGIKAAMTNFVPLEEFKIGERNKYQAHAYYLKDIRSYMKKKPIKRLRRLVRKD